MKHGSLFSGIGGFDLAAEWVGWENVFHCEMNDFGKKVLNYYWPNAESYDDITKTDFTIWRGRVDVLTGGFPCQPYSTAGKRLGKEDERHLWPEMLRAIREIQPRYVVGENVRGLTNWNGGLVFDEVQADMEAEGYEVLPFLLPAASVNAPHKRDRIWFVAYSNNSGTIFELRTNGKRSQKNEGRERQSFAKHWENGINGTSSNANSKRSPWQEHGETISGFNPETYSGCWWQNFPTQPPVCGGDDGFSAELDGITFPKWRNESIKAYGNAIVPQVVYQIFKAINEFEE